MRIGYFEHWTRPEYSYFEFLKEQGYDVKVAQYDKEKYLEDFDVVIVEQNGFNDYIENDEIYIQDWLRRGGILMFMHQDYRRWVPTFLPEELGFVQLIHRHFPTYSKKIRGYLMPWVDSSQTDLFTSPARIDPVEMIYWSVVVGGTPHVSTALSCYLPDSRAWNVLGEYKDPAVKDGALILEAKYGKGLVFLSQVLFPENKEGSSPKVFPFWKKYTGNLFAHFDNFKTGKAPLLESSRRTLPLKKNYNLGLHVHSLDWYGAHESIGSIYAALREYRYDIGLLAVKDTRLFNGALHLERYCDEHLLLLPGQEYHPFNFGGSFAHDTSNYHSITLGVPEKDMTFEFTSTIYSDKQGEEYLRKAIDFVHSKGGLAGATHVTSPLWRKYPYDMVDLAPLRPIHGTEIERHWLSGKRIALVNSIDMWGIHRLPDYPAGNFIYTDGIPTTESLIKAMRQGRVIAGTFFQSADITWGQRLPGDTLTLAEATSTEFHISAELYDTPLAGELQKTLVFAGAKKLRQIPCTGKKCALSLQFTSKELKDAPYLRVEIHGKKKKAILVSNPFYLRIHSDTL